MKTLRRFDIKDKLYFITAVTYNRRPILHIDTDLFWKSWTDSKLKAWVILPDHFHVILENNNESISNIIHRFKVKYSWHHNRNYSIGRIWQNRFWDHIIRDENDFKNHLNYIHYNPVKHSLTDDPFKYKLSSINNYKENYQSDWGIKKKNTFDNADFGE